jgi:hypothetical protein
VDVLGSAITIASRRIDVTAAIASDDPVAEQQSWDAWEDASERCAWVAASEAATDGAPSDLTYATDLRVIECSRDAHVRDEIQAARVTVGDTAWATALHAVAEEAWARGWDAADSGSKELSGIRVRDEMNRMSAALIGRGNDGDIQEYEIEAAEAAAREELTRAALRGGAADEQGEHPWDAARQVARSSPGGSTWTVLLEEARRAVGEDAWAQAMADARVATETVLRDAPDLVARIVAASVAREAASAAARGVAYRAIAVTRANSGSEKDAGEAAHEALSGVADRLRDAAFALLDRLIDPTAPVTREPDTSATPPAEPAEVPATPGPLIDLSRLHLT